MKKQVKDCDTCQYEHRDYRYEEPCMTCIDMENVNGVPYYWREKEVKDEKARD